MLDIDAIRLYNVNSCNKFVTNLEVFLHNEFKTNKSCQLYNSCMCSRI